MTAQRPALRVPLVPPGALFRFGESPFRVKGALYQGMQEFFDQNVQGGLGALLSEIAEPELRAFISQRFLPSGWYDLLPVRALIFYGARALRMPVEDYLVYRVRHQARRDLSGIHAWVLRSARPSTVAACLPTMMARTFDFGAREGIAEGCDENAMTFHGVPLQLAEWVRTVMVVYTQTALKLAGAQCIDIDQLGPAREGDQAGVPIVAVRIRFGWS